MDKQQLLENYFLHRLTPKQEKMMGDLLDNDPAFKAQFDFEKELKRVIKNKENKNLKLILNRFESDIREKPVKKPKDGFKLLALAASIVLLFGLGWYGFNNAFGSDYPALYSENFEKYPNTVFAITRSDTIQSLERQAFAAYESGNFQTAIDNFDKIPQNDQMPYLDFYRAQSYLQLEKTEEAKSYFVKNIEHEKVFVPESHWYLALTYLKKKDKTNAILQLQNLTSLYDYNKDKANALLRKLE